MPIEEIGRLCGVVPRAGRYVLAELVLEVIEAEGCLSLRNAPPPLSAEAVRRMAEDALGEVDVRVLPVIGSTNEYMLGQACAGADTRGELLVAAETQTRGRGRWGRVWVSPPLVGLWFSWRCAARALRPELLAAAAAVGVARALTKAGVRGVQLRWPNDIFIGASKTGGILVECGGGTYAVGVGLNVFGDPADYVDGTRASYRTLSVERALGAPPDRNLLLARALIEISTAARALAAGAGEGVLAAWRRAQDLPGKRVCLCVKNRREQGRVRELDPVRGIRLAECGQWFMPHEVERVEEARVE